jgi:hypothetical protein
MAAYLKEFSTHAEYEQYINGSGAILPNVSICTTEGDVHYNPDPYAGHEYVEIGGLKWATMNVGANSITDTGLYFQWGDISGYTAEQVGRDEGQKFFGWSDYKYGNGTSSPGDTGMTKYNATDGLTTLECLHKVAITGNYNDLSNKPTSLPASDVSAWAKASSKPSYAYSEIGYTATETTSEGGAISIDGTTPLQVITISAAVSGITFSAVPENGHSCHLIITASSALSVAIAHGATMYTGYTSVCPSAEDVSLDITAGGYIELDLLRVGTKIYVRGV